jgi:predicted nucleotidyltransferase
MDNTIPYIDKIISIIVSLASPDQIILFGSYARGDNTEKSDIDLLIIKKTSKMALLLLILFIWLFMKIK